MKVLKYSKIIPVALLVFSSFSSQAQNDSLYLDLGRIKLRKDFTQSITVKGTDLSRQLFVNLSSAINVWFNGAYTTPLTSLYLVDGKLVNDVNAYHINDIEEVSFVQNALVTVNGAQQEQQLIVIKTKKAKGNGVFASAKAAVITEEEIPNPFGKNVFYEDLFLSVQKSTKGANFRASGNYLHDAQQFGYDNSDKRGLNRFRFNAWADINTGKNSQLGLHIGYVPQKIKNDLESSSYNKNNDVSNNILNTSLRFNIKGKNWNNTFDADLSNSESKNAAYVSMSPLSFYDSYMSITYRQGEHKESFGMFTLRDNFSLNFKTENWAIEPSLNINLRQQKSKSSGNYTTITYNHGEISEAPSGYQTSTLTTTRLLTTPAVSFSYLNSVNLLGGVLVTLSDDDTFNGKKKLNPFVSFSADVVKLIEPSRKGGLKLYGSYASQSLENNGFLNLNDLEPLDDYPVGQALYAGSFAAYMDNSSAPKKTSIQLGASIGLGKNSSISYTHHKRNLFLYGISYNHNSNYNYDDYRFITENAKTSEHYIRLNSTIAKSKGFKWNTVITLSSLKAKIINQQSADDSFGLFSDMYRDKRTWSGGWVNRYSTKRMFLEADVLTLFFKTSNSDSYEKYFALQNFTIGSKLRGLGKGSELFFTGKNILIHEKDVKPIDSRKYFGAGLSVHF